ncbi:MAG: nucleotide pyrophosphohydrolase [Thermoproteota archaeon]|jgi:NTP pyrophosphatase (non-canonical NTP hydrolase)
MDSKTTLQELKVLVKDFVNRRNWAKYHNPKDLAESICIEAAELLEIFQWATAEEASSWKNDPSKIDSIKDELADVLIYCFSMANALDVDLSEAILKKLEKNEKKYPVEKYFGRSR